MVPRIIMSGGQTGADRAALDAALDAGVEIGGWVPKGRRAEDGEIHEKYVGLRETPNPDYEMRTRYNVRDSDATLIISHGELHGGSRYTREMAQELGKPFMHVDLDQLPEELAVTMVREWLTPLEGERLNVAGPRESGDGRIYKAVKKIITDLLTSDG